MVFFIASQPSHQELVRKALEDELTRPGRQAVDGALQQQATQKEYIDAVNKAVAQMVNGGQQAGDAAVIKPDAGEPVQEVRQAEVENTGIGGRMEGESQRFTQGSKIPGELLKTKPPYSPDVSRWLDAGGEVTIENGTWKYTNPQGISVEYQNGYPDFKGSGHVKQEVEIGDFKNRSSDFRLADLMAPNGPINPDNTWHHHEDGKTLQEVDKSIHRDFTHIGGISGLKKK